MDKCPSCGRAGDDVGTCGAFVTCPRAGVPTVPTDVILQCDRCEITRAIPASRIITGKPLVSGHPCPVGEEACECRPIVVTAKPAQGKPARGKAEG